MRTNRINPINIEQMTEDNKGEQLIKQIDDLCKTKHLRMYTTESNPNGTSGLIITDSYDQQKAFIDVALFDCSPCEGRFGACFTLYGESIIFISNLDEDLDVDVPEEEQSEERKDMSNVEKFYQDYCEFGDEQMVEEINAENLDWCLACSPMDPLGHNKLEEILTALRKA